MKIFNQIKYKGYRASHFINNALIQETDTGLWQIMSDQLPHHLIGTAHGEGGSVEGAVLYDYRHNKCIIMPVSDRGSKILYALNNECNRLMLLHQAVNGEGTLIGLEAELMVMSRGV